MPALRPRTALAGAAVALGAAAVVVAGALPAAAIATPNGQPGSTAPISTTATILLFVGIPLLVGLVVAGFTLPARAVGALRYRPGRPWGFDREWFGTRPDRVVGEAPGSAGADAAQTGGAHGAW